MKKRYIILLLLFLTACGVDPRKEAIAFETRSQAEQNALDATQRRAQEQALNDIAIQDAQRKQEIKDAAIEEAKAVARQRTQYVGLALTVVLMFVIVSTGKSMSVAIEGAGQAVARAAMVKANLIYLDPKTGQYPLLLEHVGKGIYSLTNMNTEKTLLLDTRNESDRTAIRGAIAIQHALVLSNAAAKSKDPTGVAMIQPMVIDQDAS